ncbi:MAG: hypothetical protein Q8O32_00275 [bacterium]|nr:hypothetical protein [bacterium]
MNLDKKPIIYFFRYLCLALALALILFVLSQAVFTGRTLIYNLDFSQSLSRDIVGWYPESRVAQVSNSTNSTLNILAEPIYLKIYSPVDFKTLTISGQLHKNDQGANLGLRQKDASWFFQSIVSDDFRLDFDLSNAQIKRNQLEIILSIPDLNDDSNISLVNNWIITLSR